MSLIPVMEVQLIQTEEFNDLCRLCASKTNLLGLLGLHIFEKEGDLRQIINKISACLPVEVKITDRLPKMICEECVYKLDLLFEFREKSLKTEQYFYELLKNSQQVEAIIDADIILGTNPIEEIIVHTQNTTHTISLPHETTHDISNNKLINQELKLEIAQSNVEISTNNSSDRDSTSNDAFILPNIKLTKVKNSSNSIKTEPEIFVKNEPSNCVLINQPDVTDSEISTSDDEKDETRSSQVIEISEENILTQINNDPENSYSKDKMDILDDNKKISKSLNSNDDPKESTEQKRKKWEPKICSECGKQYRTNYKLNEHMRKHTGEKPFHCSTCSKSFRSKIGLTEHEAKHTGKYEFSCSTCGKGFQCKSYLIVHQRVHSTLKPYPCTTCGRNFKTKQGLLDHMNRHLGVKPYLCETCGRRFITKGLCKSHQRVHSGTDNKQHPCTICNKLFVSKSYLNTHLRIHTGEKPFMCEVCGKGFLTRVDLKIHMTMHTGEKSFVCEWCGKAFARRDALRCHRRSHTGERPYRCDICGQSFTQFSPLTIHKRLHTGERPYPCDICSKAFVSRSTMMAHRKKHHT